jgi:hypothetical protein
MTVRFGSASEMAKEKGKKKLQKEIAKNTEVRQDGPGVRQAPFLVVVAVYGHALRQDNL